LLGPQTLEVDDEGHLGPHWAPVWPYKGVCRDLLSEEMLSGGVEELLRLVVQRWGRLST